MAPGRRPRHRRRAAALDLWLLRKLYPVGGPRPACPADRPHQPARAAKRRTRSGPGRMAAAREDYRSLCRQDARFRRTQQGPPLVRAALADRHAHAVRSEEHTSELQSLMRISYAVFCLKKKTIYTHE